MAELIIHNFIFDNFIIDTKNRQVIRNNQNLQLNTKYFDVLLYMINNHGRLITKEELFLNIWGDTFVTDMALSQCIKDIRKTLNDNARNPKYIKTVPKQGFIFLREPKANTNNDIINFKQDSISTISKRPYKFLDYYAEEDSDIYFGRELEINELCSKILSHRSFLIYGRSGVGKSSIVHAGLLPELKENGHQPFVVRSFSDPVSKINDFIKNQSSNGNEKFVCFLDQFEEFFLIAKRDVKQNFLNTIAKIYQDAKIDFRLVFVLREDLLAEMSYFKKLIPEVFFHEYRLQKLNLEQSKKAIFEPAKLQHFNIEDKLVAKIISDLSVDDYIDPPQLQIICDTLFDRKNSSSTISLHSYEKLGGAKQILTGYFEQVLKRFNKTELNNAKEILINLLNEQNEKQILSLHDLKKQLFLPQSQELKFNKLIEDLSSSRIIRIFRLDGEIWIELMHDFLVPEIAKWQNAEVIETKQAAKLFKRSFENYSAHNLIPENETILLILHAAKKLNIRTDEYNFLLESLLIRGIEIPKWLIGKCTKAMDLLITSVVNKNPETRISAIEASQYIIDNKLTNYLTEAALKDKDLSVRKSASIVLSKIYGNQVISILENKQKRSLNFLFQYAISLAFIRDYNKKLINLRNINLLISIFIMTGLSWVRFLRQKKEILNLAIKAAIGTTFSGFIVGTLLGILLLFYRTLPTFESTTILLSLASLGMLSGFSVGFGIGFGMFSLKYIGYRHSSWWMVFGAILGGCITGGIINLIGVDIFVALSGQNLIGLAGAFETAFIGLGLSLGYLITEIHSIKSKWQIIVLPAVGSMIAAIILTFIEGSMFSASIEKIAKSFIDSNIDFNPIANMFGEKYFGKISRLTLGAFEGFIFGAFFSYFAKLKK